MKPPLLEPLELPEPLPLPDPLELPELLPLPDPLPLPLLLPLPPPLELPEPLDEPLPPPELLLLPPLPLELPPPSLVASTEASAEPFPRVSIEPPHRAVRTIRPARPTVETKEERMPRPPDDRKSGLRSRKSRSLYRVPEVRRPREVASLLARRPRLHHLAPPECPTPSSKSP
jgi:hypothetical protein